MIAKGAEILCSSSHPGQEFDRVRTILVTSTAAGIDLLVLRELMGHVSPETTASYVHLSNEHVAAEYAAARAVIGR